MLSPGDRQVLIALLVILVITLALALVGIALGLPAEAGSTWSVRT